MKHKPQKIDFKKEFEKCRERSRICPVCHKRITDEMWETQEPMHLRLEHSIGGNFGSWGDEITDCFICSRECFDKAIKKINSFREWDYFWAYSLFCPKNEK